MNKEHILQQQGISMVVLLVAQYILGMATNLFVQFPENATTAQNWEFAWSQPVLVAHMILGILLLLSAIALAIHAYMRKNKVWIKASLVGLIALFVTGFAGSSFVDSQNDAYSFAMALGYVVAILSYIIGLYLNKKTSLTS